jgi:hypothetical protein
MKGSGCHGFVESPIDPDLRHDRPGPGIDFPLMLRALETVLCVGVAA